MTETVVTDVAGEKPVNRGGAPKGSANALRHGLACGRLPKGAQWVGRLTDRFRRSLEAATMAAHGQVSLTNAASINSAARWERHAQLALLWLRKSGEKMSDADRLNHSREIAKASAERDKCIRALGLDSESVLDSWYDSPQPLRLETDHRDQPTSGNAGDERTEAKGTE